ncbi:MAG: hypothetical protein ACM3NH_03820 [Candidatus Saccharibacteria bacterium]
MNSEYNKPNIERRDGGFDHDDLLREVIPGAAGSVQGNERKQDSQPIEPFELPKTSEAAAEVHEEIPGHPLKAKLSEKEARDAINKILNGRYEDPSEMTEFLSNQIEGQG